MSIPARTWLIAGVGLVGSLLFFLGFKQNHARPWLPQTDVAAPLQATRSVPRPSPFGDGAGSIAPSPGSTTQRVEPALTTTDLAASNRAPFAPAAPPQQMQPSAVRATGDALTPPQAIRLTNGATPPATMGRLTRPPMRSPVAAPQMTMAPKPPAAPQYDVPGYVADVERLYKETSKP
jgi:hypothetical protein